METLKLFIWQENFQFYSFTKKIIFPSILMQVPKNLFFQVYIRPKIAMKSGINSARVWNVIEVHIAQVYYQT